MTEGARRRSTQKLGEPSRPAPRARKASVAQREIPLRELRNDISRVLAEVERQGTRFTVTVNGRPVADLVPVTGRRVWVPWAELERIRREAPLDPDFERDVAEALHDVMDDER